MKYSYNWLKELSGTKKSPEQLAKLLMMHAFEVEGIEKYAHGLDGVVIGRVESLAKHPNADRLQVAQVRVNRTTVTQIVCGASNIQVDQMVVVATPGTTLPGGVTISEVKLRDVQSAGMICSEKELGLGENHDGILVLPNDAPLGAYFAKYYGFEDTIIDIKILPDRGGDALSHEGIAREIAALDGYAPRFTEKAKKKLKIPSYNRAPKVIVADKKLCSRYGGLLVRQIHTAPSPLWLQARLLVLGQRPKNTVVDITNYLMLLTGQPLHSFDADKIEGAVTVRNAKKGEKLKLLTDVTLKLTEEDIVIADRKKVLALAGIMGGKQSAITDRTTNIFVEVASFEAASIRKSKQRHNLQTDAAYRFERGVDSELATEVLPLAGSFYTELCGARISGMRDIRTREIHTHKIQLSEKLVSDVLGVRVPLFEIVRLLALLGLKVKKKADKAVLEVTIPSRRKDLEDSWNLIEEIGRMYGYEKISAEAPLVPLTLPLVSQSEDFIGLLKTAATQRGFDEVLTYSFYGKEQIKKYALSEASHTELEQPLTPEYAYLRQSLLPILLEKTEENKRHYESFGIFECGNVFEYTRQTVVETKKVAFVEYTKTKNSQEVFFLLKERLFAFLKALQIEGVTIEPLSSEEMSIHSEALHKTRSGVIKIEGVTIGVIGMLHPGIAKRFSLAPESIAVTELDVESLFHGRVQEKQYRPLNRFPLAVRDITLWFPKTVSAAEALQVVQEGGGELLLQATLYDIYDKDDLKSYSFHLSFGSYERTLTTVEMDVSFDTIVLLAKERYGGYIRL